MNIRKISKGVEIDIDDNDTLRADACREEQGHLQLYYQGDLVALVSDGSMTLPQRGFDSPIYTHGVTIETDDIDMDELRESL